MRDHGFLETNGIRMHYVSEGDGPPVVLLHGFPQHWYTWRHQLKGLAAAGYRAIAPDLRGYGETDRPKKGYDLESLVKDIEGLAARLELESFYLVGHDWGGPIAWKAAANLKAVKLLVQLNGPHPVAYLRNLLTTRQFLKSWYFYIFLIPGVAERLLRLRDDAGLRALIEEGRRRAPQTITEADVQQLTEAMQQPGALEAGLRYYRATVGYRSMVAVSRMKLVHVPTMVVWGLKDRALVPQKEQQLKGWVKAPLEVHYVEDAGHWIGEEQPERINHMLVDFLERHG